MNLPISYSKYNTFSSCPIKYFHQYVIKTKIEEDLTYPLVLGQLTHLFIKLYNDGILPKIKIRNIKDDLSVLYEYIDLKYPAISNTGYEIKTMDVSSNVEKTINFINENEVVFHHAVKLFNLYHERFFPKINQGSYFMTEATFYNVVDFEGSNVCYYGSIDLLFHHPEFQYLYISDFKTGKSLYDYYYEQLFFYYYNLKNYNMDMAPQIKNNPDNIEKIKLIKENMTLDNVHLLLFNVREGKHEKKLLKDVNSQYDTFIERLNNDVADNIVALHRDKELVSFIDIRDQYQDRCKFVDVEKAKTNNLSFTCTYCKFKEDCQYRILK